MLDPSTHPEIPQISMKNIVRDGEIIEIQSNITEALFSMLASGTIISNSKLEALSENSEINGVITTERSHFYLINENSFGKMEEVSSILKKLISEESESYVEKFQNEVFWLYTTANIIIMFLGLGNVFTASTINTKNDYNQAIFMTFSEQQIESLLHNAEFYL